MNFRRGASAGWQRRAFAIFTVIALASCGGDTGNPRDSGIQKTFLRVEATDNDGDALQYQWRVTAGRIDNPNAREAVWTMPAGPGVHFAYVTVSDGRGGYVEQQYAVSTDRLDIPPAPPAMTIPVAPASFDAAPSQRLQFRLPALPFDLTRPDSDRIVYAPDVQVQLLAADDRVLFSATSDVSGEVFVPPLAASVARLRFCSPGELAAAPDCRVVPQTTAPKRSIDLSERVERNLRLYGHIGLADGGVCGVQNEFAALNSAATIQLLQQDGTALTPPVRVNRFGDYALDASVPVRAALRLRVQCEGFSRVLDVPPSTDPVGYVSRAPVLLSTVVPNSRPRITKVVANGPDGNVRGRMLVPLPDAASNGLPGADQFLTFKGRDTKLGACLYYRSFGVVAACDASGNPSGAISFEAWKRKHGFRPYGSTPEVSATYINKMDLNLVRRMVATQSGPNNVAFYVCNSPGPEGASQREIDLVIEDGVGGLGLIACVAMEWSVTAGANGGLPFTKFLTFGPDGGLLLSVNLDGRGEKFLPGTCVACHGGGAYSGKFPERGSPSPFLGSAFLPFDTGNYQFSTAGALTEMAQSAALKELNRLVRVTEGVGADTPITQLIDGWYDYGRRETLDKAYLPANWQNDNFGTTRQQKALFYREVAGAVCRTCHVALPVFDLDRFVLGAGVDASIKQHFCGGSPDVALNASMPNALVSRDRLMERVRTDVELASLMRRFLGCDAPLPDPVHPRR